MTAHELRRADLRADLDGDFDGKDAWHPTIDARHVPRPVEPLCGSPDQQPLDMFEQHWSGAGSYRLERLVRNRVDTIPSDLVTWS